MKPIVIVQMELSILHGLKNVLNSVNVLEIILSDMAICVFLVKLDYDWMSRYRFRAAWLAAMKVAQLKALVITKDYV